jgi:hypothetical protein
VKSGRFDINHSTGSMIDVNQRLEDDIPGPDQALLNAAQQARQTSRLFIVS